MIYPKLVILSLSRSLASRQVRFAPKGSPKSLTRPALQPCRPDYLPLLNHPSFLHPLVFRLLSARLSPSPQDQMNPTVGIHNPTHLTGFEIECRVLRGGGKTSVKNTEDAPDDKGYEGMKDERKTNKVQTNSQVSTQGI